MNGGANKSQCHLNFFRFLGLSVYERNKISKTYKQLMQLNILKKKKTNKQPDQKMGRRSKFTLLQRRPTDGQQTHKMLNMTN